MEYIQRVTAFVAASLLALAAIAAAGCGASDERPNAQPSRDDAHARADRKAADARKQRAGKARRELHGNWRLTSGAGPSGAITPVPGYPFTLRVDRDRVSGTGCNTSDGHAEATPTGFSITQKTVTLVGCEPEQMAADSAYFAALQAVHTARQKGDRLILTGEATELRFARLGD